MDTQLPGNPGAHPGMSAPSSNGISRMRQSRDIRKHHGGGNDEAAASGALAELGKYKREIRMYAGVLTVFLAVYELMSDGDFSFILTLATMIQAVSFVTLAVFVETTNAINGVSVKMMECYLLGQASKLIAVVPFEGYIPYDRTGDWFYAVMECATFVVMGSIVHTLKYRNSLTYDPTLGQTSDKTKHVYYIIASALLAVWIHPSLNDLGFSNVAYAFSLYMETIAILPQINMIDNINSKGENWVRKNGWMVHFLIGMSTAKLLNLIFWTRSWREVMDLRKLPRDHKSHPEISITSYLGMGLGVAVCCLGCQVLQLLMQCKFIYQYLRDSCDGDIHSTGGGIAEIVRPSPQMQAEMQAMRQPNQAPPPRAAAGYSNQGPPPASNIGNSSTMGGAPGGGLRKVGARE